MCAFASALLQKCSTAAKETKAKQKLEGEEALETDVLMNEQQAAQRLNVAVKTLQKWRVVGGGPRFVKLGRCVRYTLADLGDFIAVHRVPHTSALTAQAPEDLGAVNSKGQRHAPA